MPNRRLTLALGALLVAAIGVQVTIHACGPFFPNRVLIGGDAEVLKAPVANFRTEIDRLKPEVPRHLKAVPPEEKREEFSGQSVSQQVFDTDVADLAAALDASQTPTEKKRRLLEAFTGTREQIHAYIEHRKRWQSMQSTLAWYQRLDRAPPPYYINEWARHGLDPKDKVQPVYRKPEVPAGLPEEFAAYLRGAVHYHAGDFGAAEKEWKGLLKLPEAKRRYRSTWAAFMLGKLAMLDEAAFMLGNLTMWDEEARGAEAWFQLVRSLAKEGYHDSLGLASSSLGWEAKVCLREERFTDAVGLYLAQHASGDDTALPSLQLTCGMASKAPGMGALHTDATSRKVMTAYLLSWGGPFMSRPREQEVDAWLRMMEGAGVEAVTDADRLAWVAYQAGEPDRAARWVALADPESPMTHWLQAKLFLRKGLVDEATEHLRSVVKELAGAEEQAAPYHLRPRDGEERDLTSLRVEVWGELGVLLLARREFQPAMHVLLKGGHWEDAAYIAERVLSPDELKAAVDKTYPEPPAGATLEQDTPEWCARRLRHLLARRLTRLGRWKEARPYYPPAWRPRLDQYIQAIGKGHAARVPRKQRAANLWQAACLARHEGLNLLGTELAPDSFSRGGRFPDDSIAERRQEEGPDNPLSAPSAEELRRDQAHTPPINKRWHWRYVATDHAWRAAALMPDNHELTAKMLWVAGAWLKARDPKEADRFYKALVLRCPATELGQDADRLRWFPKIEIDEGALLKEVLAFGGLESTPSGP